MDTNGQKEAGKGQPASRTRSIARCGVAIALIAVSAMVVVPFGPVPFTMQTCAVVLVILLLTPGEACAAVGGYLLLGALGMPVFAGMRGGIGVIAGPTGGFLIGFLVAAIVAGFIRRALQSHQKAADWLSALAVIVCSYVFGWAQLMVVASLDPLSAFLAGIAPFIAIDIVKAVIACGLAVPVRAGISHIQAGEQSRI